MKLTVFPGAQAGLEQWQQEQFQRLQKDGSVEAGILLDTTSKATTWQIKARMMEFLGVPPIAASLAVSPSGKPLLETDMLFDQGIRSGGTLYYSVKQDVAKNSRSKLPITGTISRSTSSGLASRDASPSTPPAFSALASSGISFKKYFASKKKALPSAELSFATGRGLRQAVLHQETEFDLYAVDRMGMFLPTDSYEWEITLELFDESGLQFAGIKMSLEHDKITRRCCARYTPERPGNYLLAVKMKLGAESVTVAGSPFAVEVIDVDNRAEVKLASMCLEESWSLEISIVLLGLSREAEAHRRIFEEIGLPAILQMVRYRDERIAENLAGTLENLLMIDQNKVRMVSEGSIELVRTLSELCSRVHRPSLMSFMGKVLALLVEQDQLRSEVVLALGLNPIQRLLAQQDSMCQLSAVRALVHISADEDHREVLLSSGIVNVLWGLMVRNDDVFLQRLVIRALANLSDSKDRFELDAKSFEKVIDRMTSTDSLLNIGAAHILANLTLKSEYVEKCLVVLDRICGVVASAQIRFEWEHASIQALLTASSIDDEPLVGDTTYELNFYFMRILANLLQQKSEESKQIIARNRVLGILVHFARSYDLHVKNEACRALAQFCDTISWLEEVMNASAASGDKMAPLITLMCSGELTPLGQVNVVRKMQQLLESSKGLKAQAMISYIDSTGQDLIVSLLNHADTTVQRSASIVLAGIVKNEAYKSHIVKRGGSTFLNNLMLLVKEGVVEVQRSVDLGEVEWLEIIGKGVSGTVWKGVWQKKVCAVKRFHEDNIAFDEEEFNSELAMMSVLRHPNIVNSLGGCTRRESLFIISELYSKGSVADAIVNKNFAIDLNLALQMLIDTAAGMQYLHTLNILHRDLKAGNLLVSDNMVVCVTDFGVSKMMTQEMTKAAGTPMYMSPEILEGRPYMFSADTYSFGFVIWELLARKLPYGEMIPWEITKKVVEEELRPEPLNHALDALTNVCWAQNPNLRPNFTMILHYLKEIQSAHRMGGDIAFKEACVQHFSILTVFEANSIPVTPRIVSVNKARADSGYGGTSMATASEMRHSASAMLGGGGGGNSTLDEPSGSETSGATSSKFILNMLPLTRGRKSYSERKSNSSLMVEEGLLSPKSTMKSPHSSSEKRSPHSGSEKRSPVLGSERKNSASGN